MQKQRVSLLTFVFSLKYDVNLEINLNIVLQDAVHYVKFNDACE